MPAVTHPGAMDRRIVIRQATYTANNDWNEPVPSWSNTTVWAKATDVSASEAYRAQEVGAEITTRFTIRWSTAAATINPKDEVVFNGRTYNVTAVRDIDRNAFREIDAVAKADR